jgi:hypothetical protein
MEQPVTVFKNLSSPLILGVDAIDNLGITYLLRTKSFTFQEALNPEKFQKADLRVISSLKIPAHTGVPVRLRLGQPLVTIKTQCQVVLFASMDFPLSVCPTWPSES